MKLTSSSAHSISSKNLLVKIATNWQEYPGEPQSVDLNVGSEDTLLEYTSAQGTDLDLDGPHYKARDTVPHHFFHLLPVF